MKGIPITCSVSGAGKKTIRTKPSSGSASRLGPLWTSKYQPLGGVHTPSPGREFIPSGGAFTGGKEGEDMEGEGLGEYQNVLLTFLGVTGDIRAGTDGRTNTFGVQLQDKCGFLSQMRCFGDGTELY
jgi:hypothetical protein